MSNEARQENLLSRITVKTVYGEIKKEVVEKAKELHIMRVYGQSVDMKIATSQYGDSVGFLGQFKAANPDTGEMFRSGKCYLPKVAENLLAGAQGGEKANAVEFALDIFAIPANNAFGYEYRVKPVIAVAESPVMLALEEKLKALPALAAPAAASGKKK